MAYRGRYIPTYPKKYKGDGDKLQDFITSFRRYIEWEKIPDDKATKLIAFYLDEEALICYDLLSKEDKKSLERIFNALNARFYGSSFKMAARQRLYTEGMRSDEYISEGLIRYPKHFLCKKRTKYQSSSPT